MTTLLLIFLIGFIWITRDIIRVPETFNNSWFKRFKGDQWIDPQISWINKGNYHMIFYPILSMFGDLFHTLGSLIIFGFILVVYRGVPVDLSFIEFVIFVFLSHGLGVWLGYNLWRKVLN